MKMRIGRKGVSPVIATLLLILIAVAAAILVYVWVTGFATSTTSTPPTGKINVKIEAAYYSGGNVIIYLRNIGDVDAVIDAVYIWDSGMKTLSASTSGLSTTVTPGALTSITVSATLSSGNYLIKVVTVDGYEFIARITV